MRKLLGYALLTFAAGIVFGVHTLAYGLRVTLIIFASCISLGAASWFGFKLIDESGKPKEKSSHDGNYFSPDWGRFSHYTLKAGWVYTESGEIIRPGVWRRMKLNSGIAYSRWTDAERAEAREKAAAYAAQYRANHSPNPSNQEDSE